MLPKVNACKRDGPCLRDISLHKKSIDGGAASDALFHDIVTPGPTHYERVAAAKLRSTFMSDRALQSARAPGARYRGDSR
jgi:hypothetical protein